MRPLKTLQNPDGLSHQATGAVGYARDSRLYHGPESTGCQKADWKIHSAVGIAGDTAYSGAERSDILPGIRHKVTGQYVVFYRVEGADVVILRVLHGRRDLTAEEFDE
jgi:hypothetical protein